MTGRIRTLVVDDSVVIRRLICDALETDPMIDVVGTASNGVIALKRIEQLRPDILTLDIEMPEMDGLSLLAEMNKRGIRLPVIMFSTLSTRGATETLKALSLGAKDYVTKPSNVGGIQAAMAQVREELIPRIKSLTGHADVPTAPRVGTAPTADDPVVLRARPTATFPPSVLAIGTSTGGPNALLDVLVDLPASLPVPVVIVQHMPPVFTAQFASRLDSKCPLHVVEGAPGMLLQAGTVYIAPGGYHMVVERRGNDLRLATNEEPPENSCRPAVDVLFRSVVDIFGGRTFAVILTGMGKDGLEGCQRVVAAGGEVIVQDEATSVVWGMPGFVARAGLATEVLPLGDVASAINRRFGAGRAMAQPTAARPASAAAGAPRPPATPTPGAARRPAASPTPAAAPRPAATATPGAARRPGASPTPAVAPRPAATTTPGAAPRPAATPTPGAPPTPAPASSPANRPAAATQPTTGSRFRFRTGTRSR